jgi:hypothetical protein
MLGQMSTCDANLIQFRTHAGTRLCAYSRGETSAKKLANAILSPVDRQS